MTSISKSAKWHAAKEIWLLWKSENIAENVRNNKIGLSARENTDLALVRRSTIIKTKKYRFALFSNFDLSFKEW